MKNNGYLYPKKEMVVFFVYVNKENSDQANSQLFSAYVNNKNSDQTYLAAFAIKHICLVLTNLLF